MRHTVWLTILAVLLVLLAGSGRALGPASPQVLVVIALVILLLIVAFRYRELK